MKNQRLLLLLLLLFSYLLLFFLAKTNRISEDQLLSAWNSPTSTIPRSQGLCFFKKNTLLVFSLHFKVVSIECKKTALFLVQGSNFMSWAFGVFGKFA